MGRLKGISDTLGMPAVSEIHIGKGGRNDHYLLHIDFPDVA